MNCKTAEKHWVAFLDGTVDSRGRHEMETHLRGCDSCRQRAGEFRTVWSLLEEASPTGPSAGFDAAVRARVNREAVRRGLWGWLIAPSPRLALAVTALLIFSVWLSSLRPAVRPPVQAPLLADAEFRMIADLPVLENYDVLANFEVLSELPVEPASARGGM